MSMGMRSIGWAVLALVLPAIALGAGAKLDPVAPGLPVWQGVGAKNHVLGRTLCPSDLRQKVVIVLEVEATDQLGTQLAAAMPLLGFTQLKAQGGFGGEDDLPPHDVLLVINCGGLKDRDLVRSTFNPKKGAENTVDLKGFVDARTPVYEDLTFEGAPEIPLRPYVYVMGPLRTEPLFNGKFDESALGEVQNAINRGFSEMDKGKWVPFYGPVLNTKYNPIIAKNLEKGKPLAPVAKQVLAEMVATKDADKQQELQRLYDSLNQTRSELVHKIHLEAASQPLMAICDIQKLTRYWPTAKKQVDEVTAKFKAIPGMDKLGAAFAKAMVWANPAFKPKGDGEAKKIVAELTNLKKQLAKYKDSKIPQLAAAYQVAEAKLDELISDIPGRVTK